MFVLHFLAFLCFLTSFAACVLGSFLLLPDYVNVALMQVAGCGAFGLAWVQGLRMETCE